MLCLFFFSSLWLVHVLDDDLQNSVIKLRPFVWSVMQTWPYAEKSNKGINKGVQGMTVKKRGSVGGTYLQQRT